MHKKISLKTAKEQERYSLKNAEATRLPLDYLEGSKHVHSDGYPEHHIDSVYHVSPEQVTILYSNIPKSSVLEDINRTISLEFFGRKESVEKVIKRLDDLAETS